MKPADNIKKENPFRVPAGYFENLTDRTVTAIKESQETPGKSFEKPSPRFRLTPFLALAAAIIGFAVIAAGLVKLFSDNGIGNKDNGQLYTEALNADIDTYMIEDEIALSPSELKDEVPVPADAIIEYLLLENIELTEIYEFL